MFKQVLQHIELYAIRHKELKKLKIKRYQTMAVSQHLARDMNTGHLNQISVGAEGQVDNEFAEPSWPPVKEDFKLSCACFN